MSDRLKAIVEDKRKRLEARKGELPLADIKRRMGQRDEFRSFAGAIAQAGRTNVIAEIKKASPSAGVIRENFDPVAIAKEYEAGGAAALSILTEERFFQGDISYLEAVRAVTSIPLLRKDFIFDPYQVYESCAFGADALLLIAAVVDADRMKELINLAGKLKMDCLVEVHTREEVREVLKTPARIIGINNRDLRDFSVNAARAIDIAAELPAGRTVVIESGIKSRKDIEPYLQKNIRVFLVGETLMRSPDPKETLKELRDNG